MSNDESEVQYTQHAFLVAWGWFGEHIGLIRRLLAVSLHQKRYHHTPQGKVLEFLVVRSGLDLIPVLIFLAVLGVPGQAWLIL